MLKSPVILGNAPSSGSTLLANLLGRAPSIYRRNEVTVFDKADWLNADQAVFQRKWRSWFRSGYPRRLGCEMRVVFTNMDAQPPEPRAGEDYLGFLLRFMDDLAIEAGCERWVEKTPANIFSFRTLLDRVQDARFIVIHRDARSVVSSLMRRGFSAPLAAVRWYLPNLAAHAVAADPRVKMIAYERLVEYPAETLRDLFDFIGETIDPEQLGEESTKDSTTLESWRAAPTKAVSKSALWTDGQHLPEIAREALSRIRATDGFLASVGLSDAPSAIELQELLGYASDGCASNRHSISLAAAEIRDRAKYYTSLARYGLRPKPVPFAFDREERADGL